ncbi:MAG TPA: DEAD/DEAH box helicase family protein [Novosphingobium sp.]|nr:DEAD/DEAH box helicase family protein [Novosphingobium sp.]
MLSRMSFGGQWRDYQQRVLEEFEGLIADRRLHVVAAPGSGKTVLGLELIRRFGHPALVLAPSRTIRDQWAERLVPLFLPEPPGAEELSRDLAALRGLTCTTYQALHAHWADDDGGARFAALVEQLKAHGALTLVLDEAHHLRREWWSALTALVDALPQAHLVALTATPPYDAPAAEWARYDAMCGPIDLEIGAPELVRRGDLCPHQDHVLFSRPDQDALDLLEARRAWIAQLSADLRADGGFLTWLGVHPWLVEPDRHAEAILEAPELLSAVLVLLASAGRELPSAPLKLLGVKARDVPPPSAFWLEVLLNGFLFSHAETFRLGEERVKHLRSGLSKHGLIEGSRVKLEESKRIFTLMAGSLAKLDSIAAIAAAEAAALGGALRLLVLSDHVRAEELPRRPMADYRPAKLGVVPVFEVLRRSLPPGQRPGVLTGTLVILPDSAVPALHQLGRARGVEPEDLRAAALPGCPGYARIEASGKGETALVGLVTALFQAGDITLLVGTQALLGEGWDAPCVNSLVLASNSAAFMLSNQMRGRAIRIDPAAPDKVANIWHLASVETLPAGPLPGLAQRLEWGRLDRGDGPTSDYDLLERRFRAFEGIANGESARITNGIERLGLWQAESLDACNARTLALAADRAGTAARWQRSFGCAAPRAHVREVASPNYAPQRLAWGHTLSWLAISAGSAGALAGANELRTASTAGNLPVLAMAVAGAATLASLPRLAQAARLAWRNGSLESSLTQVGQAVLHGLREAGAISDAQWHNAQLVVERDSSGVIDLLVEGVPRAAERTVLAAMAEVLGPVGNPRYLLVRKSRLGLKHRTDYHAVPEAIGRQKAWAEAFHREWEQQVGPSDLVFTRTGEGRIALLRARARSFAAGFQRRVDRRSAWR